jgi:hypothetical protein
MNVGMLVSWHYLRRCVAAAMPSIRQVRTVLDSGAFSATSSGAPINLTEYARFIRQNGPAFDWCASLDVIGDPVRSYANWLALRQSWPDVVPAVHYGADHDWLRRYIGEGAKRVALGGLVPHANSLRNETSPVRVWLDAAFATMDGAGTAVHGFGVTGKRAVLAYPWTTVDSSSATVATIFRRLVHADGRVTCADTGWATAAEARSGADPWEVRKGSHSRCARLRANLAGLEGVLSSSKIERLYHAIDPTNGVDIRTTVQHLLHRASGEA